MSENQRVVQYQHILVAVDIAADVQPVLEKAIASCEEGTKLSILHIVEPVFYPDNYGGSVPVDLQQKAIEYCESEFKQLSEQYAIPPECWHVLVGYPGRLINEYAEKKAVDLIVVGSHGKHGIQLLLGSTANAILHHAKCDVLAVRIFE